MRLVLVVALAVLAAVLVWTRPRAAERRAPPQAPDVAAAMQEAVATEKPGPVGGKVLPACRARVHYYDYGNGDAPLASVEAREDGSFRFPEEVREKGVLLAEADGFRPAWFAMDDLAEVTLTMEPGGPLPYLVTDPEERPIAGAEIEVWHLYSLSGHYTRVRLRTGSDGVALVNAGLEERFTVAAEGFEPETFPHPERADDPRLRTFVLFPRLRIGGRVVDPMGQPVANAEVRYRADERTLWPEAPTARVDGGSRFETPPLRAQRYEIQATAPGWAEARAEARPGDAEILLRVDRAARIEGRVLRPGGAPATGAELWASGAAPLSLSAADGSFVLDGIPPGSVTLCAYWYGPVEGPDPPDETTWRCTWPFELKPGESRTGVEVTLSGASYSWVPLRLVDGKSAPLAGILVDTGSLSVLDADESRTDENGFVLIRTEDAPGYETRFEFPAENNPALGIDRSCRIVTLPPGTTEVVEVKLRAPIRATFVVLDEKGAPIPAAANPTVFVFPGDGRVVQGDRVEVLVAPSADDPRAEYVVQASGFAAVSVADWVPTQGETIEVRMRKAAVLRGSVTAADGRPMSDLIVTCAGSVDETDEAGRFAFDRLEPGPVELRVWSRRSPLPLLRRQLELRVGMNDVGVLKAPAAETIRGRVTDEAGRPVGGALIEVLEPGVEAGAVATTREDGTFFLRIYQPTRVLARKPGFGAAIAGPEDLSSIALPADGTLSLRVPPEVYWSGLRVTLPDGSEINWVHGGWEGDAFRLLELPPGPLTIDFISDPDGRVTATCTDRATVVPWR